MKSVGCEKFKQPKQMNRHRSLSRVGGTIYLRIEETQGRSSLTDMHPWQLVMYINLACINMKTGEPTIFNLRISESEV
jgi:hypothetical protein